MRGLPVRIGCIALLLVGGDGLDSAGQGVFVGQRAGGGGGAGGVFDEAAGGGQVLDGGAFNLAAQGAHGAAEGFGDAAGRGQRFGGGLLRGLLRLCFLAQPFDAGVRGLGDRGLLGFDGPLQGRQGRVGGRVRCRGGGVF